MIDTAVVMLVALDRLPWVALIILLRDVILVGGYRFVVPKDYELEVSRLGKIATWGLYASIGFTLVTSEGTTWPIVCFWISLALAVVAAVQYILDGGARDPELRGRRRTLRTGDRYAGRRGRGAKSIARAQSLKLRSTP